MRIQIEHGDITQETTDAIVNAAKETLLGGGGVDGAIHSAAGPGLLEECKRLPCLPGGSRCLPGKACITAGYDLKAKHVIHTVGPIWRGGEHGEDDILRSCYHESLRLAGKYNLRSVSFPAISTGIYGFPLQRATEIAIHTVASGLQLFNVELARLIVFSKEDEQVYLEVAQRLLGKKR